MHLHEKPMIVTEPTESAGALAVGLIVMDDDGDVTYTTGYYWRRVSSGDDPADADLWRAAVYEGNGPLNSVREAGLAGTTATAELRDFAWRLAEGASVIRAGHVAPSMPDLLDYLERALAINQQRRSRPDAAGRTARGLFVQDGFKATAKANAEADARKTKEEAEGTSYLDGAVLPDRIYTEPGPPQPDDERENELDAKLTAAFGGEDEYHAALARLQTAEEEAPDVEIPPDPDN